MRQLQFYERRTDTREVSNVKIFGIDDMEEHFNETLRHIEEQLNLSERLEHEGNYLEAEEILRSQIIFIESAYDFFLHELLRLGIYNFFSGVWSNKSEKYLKLEVPLYVLEKVVLERSQDDLLKDWITERYSHVTLMDFDALKNKICEMLGIKIKEVADLAFYAFGSEIDTEAKLQAEIDNIYSRRNQIAHQADRKMSTAERERIDKEFVKDKIRNIRKIVLALCEIVRVKDGKTRKYIKTGSCIKSLRRDIISLLSYKISIMSAVK